MKFFLFCQSLWFQLSPSLVYKKNPRVIYQFSIAGDPETHQSNISLTSYLIHD